MVYKSGQIFLPFCQGSRVSQTDGQADRRTDRILIARPRLHFMQRGKNRRETAFLTHIVINLFAKFEVSSFNSSRDIRGPKIPKVGHVTPDDGF